MNLRVIQNEDRESALNEAAAWHMRLEGNSTDVVDFAAFSEWISVPAHRSAFDQLDRISFEIDAHKEQFRRALASAGESASGSKRGVLVSRRAWVMGALAACAAVFVARPLLGPQLEWATYRTGVGEVRRIALNDGSTIMLNARSSIRVALGKHMRRVEMADAQASFQVAHNAAWPFIVSAGDREILVTGTEFDVTADAARTIVSVRSGHVRVGIAGEAAREVAQLSAGQQLTHRTGERTDHIQNIAPDEAIAWQSGHLVYSHARLADIVADLNRYYARPIRLADAETSALVFTGVLSIDQEEAVVRRLETYLGLQSDQSASTITLRRKAH